MGIFKDFATSGYGDFTIGALDGITASGERDAKRNAVFAQDSLNKENKAFAETELAFKNKKEITNIISNNPFAFGITATADLNVNQIADRLTNRIFNEQRSIFENNDFNKVKQGVAKYLTRPDTLGQGIELSTPYTPSEDLFTAEQEKHSARLSAISKMPKVDKLLMNVQRAEDRVVSPEALTDSLTKVAGITAKGYGILDTYPNTKLGNTNLKFMQTNIIVANARAQFPNDAAKRSQFIEKKLFDNNINSLDAINFQNPVTYKQITKVLDTQGNALASKITENTNAMAAAETDEQRVQIQNQTNQLIMQQYALINTYSGSAGFALAGKDADKVGVTAQPVIPPVEEKPEEEGQTPGLFKRETKPRRPLKEVLPDFRGEEPEDTGLDPFQASFKLNDIDRSYIVNQWSENYQGEGKFSDKVRANKDLMVGSFDIPEDAANDINDISDIFDGDNNFNRNQIAEILGAIGFFESKYKTKVQGGEGPARSYWQVEPATAKSILTQNINAMKTGRKQFLGPKFEALFKNKYKNAIGNRTALEYFASLSEDQLKDLLLKDGAFAASMAAHKVITTFDPYSAEKQIEV